MGATLEINLAPEATLTELSPEALRAWCRELPVRPVAPETVIYRGRNQLHRDRVAGVEVVVKAFPNRGLYKRLVYRWRSSKARRSLDNALRLQQLGLPTPRPLAAIEQRRGGVLLRSFYVCAWCNAGSQVREALKRRDFPRRRMHLYRVGALVARLHAAGVVHRDLSPGNILIHRRGPGFCYPLLDLNRMHFAAPPDLATAMANLAGLESRDRTGRLSLLVGYCAAAGCDRHRALELHVAAVARHRIRWRFKNAWRAWRKGFAGRPGQIPGRTGRKQR